MIPLSTLTAKERRLTLLGLGVLTLVEAVSWPLAMTQSRGFGVLDPSWTAWVSWTAAVCACGALLLNSAVGNRAVWWCGTAALTLALYWGGLITVPEWGTGFAHPSLALGIGGAIAAGLTTGSWSCAWGGWLLLGIGYSFGLWRSAALGLDGMSPLLGNLVTLLGAAVIARFLCLRLGQAASCAAELSEATARLAEVEARETERARQYRMVHDTVLSTLSALSRGTLNPAEPAVRGRITSDAEYLRGLIATTGSGAGMFLVGELALMTREFSSSGLRVHPHIADVPGTLPQDLLRALTESIREALNNVVKHSGTRQAWVTIVGEDDGVVVTITDRGRGFDPRAPARGMGLRGSIRARMADVGGVAEIDSAPGQGTTVELRWPA